MHRLTPFPSCVHPRHCKQCSCLHRMLPSWSGISRGNLSAAASFQPKYGRCSPAWILEPRELSTQILSNMKSRHAGLWLASWSFELAIRQPRTCSEWLFCVAGESSCRLRIYITTRKWEAPGDFGSKSFQT